MSIFHAVILGIVQGLTEFLPISSSGHLILVPWILEWDDFAGDKSLAKTFDVALHIGTLVAVVAYFWSDLKLYVRDGVRAVVHRHERATPAGRLAWLLVLSAVPAAAVGALFEEFIDEQLGTVPILAVSLILGGLLLWVADQMPAKRGLEGYSVRDALIVGAGQALALNPGTSRSGITITTGRFLSFNRDAAARISFLMAIPVTLGAVVFKVGNLALDGIPSDLVAPMIAGVISAGLSGWLAVWGTLKLVRTRSFAPFVIYRVVAGTVVLIVYFTGLR
jgi:undecaprenyl-diphosphatase